MLALVGLGGARAPGQDDAEAPAWGLLCVSDDQPQAAGELLTIAGGVLGWASGESAWEDVAARLANPDAERGAVAWRLVCSGSDALIPARDAGEASLSDSFSFDLAADLNALRRLSEQPFSRSVRGRSLDALGIDNARRARLSGVLPASDDGLSIVLFSESRSQGPGRWHPETVATVRLASGGGEETKVLELDFGGQWEGVGFTLADLCLAMDPASGAISPQERFAAWGAPRVGALRGLLARLGPAVWIWRDPGGEGVAAAVPLRRATTQREVASDLRAVLGARLSWERDPSAERVGTLALTIDAGPDADRRLSVRFVTAGGRTVLAIALREGALERVPGVLEALAR